MKYGLHAPIPGAVKLKLANYLDYSKLPVPTGDFGHYDLVSNWGMLGNDQWGDCAWAGACHQVMLNCAESSTTVSFSEATALKNYSATGFNLGDGPSGDNPTDQGTDVGFLAKYWQNPGIVDDVGTRHQIVAYAALNPGDLRELWVATSLFQSVGLGFAIPDSAQDQFAAGQPWDVVPGATIEGGHYVPCVGRKGSNGVIVTWGAIREFTPNFYQTYNDQGIVGLSLDMLIKGATIDGVDMDQLQADLKALAA